VDKHQPLILVGRVGAFFFRWKKSVALLSLLAIWFYFSLPAKLFQTPFSPVLLDSVGHLLDARVALDQQWRFPPQGETLPEKYLRSLVFFEDKRFFSHPGVDPLAVIRAFKQNLAGKNRISGASTLTMQVIRLWRKAPRTWWNKLREALWALRLELRCSKNEILGLYALHAPMGRNILGAWSASWLYFNRPLGELSWAESALLAVLPNAPSTLHPGRGREGLRQKRNRLLSRLCAAGIIDELTRDLAMGEDLPPAEGALGQRAAVHLLDTLVQMRDPGDLAYPLYQSTIDYDLQLRAEGLLRSRQRELAKSRINDVCALIIDHETSEVKAYLGNGAYLAGERGQGAWVDLLRRPRSTGSILKPFLYASMVQEGELTPQQLVEDIPTYIRGFSPQNFSRRFLGAVPAREALAYSLNVPAVRMLRRYGLQRFYDRLLEMGMDTLQRSADGYGLTLILGGAEGTVWNIAGLYSRLAQAAMGKGNARPVSALRQSGKGEPAVTWPISRGAAYLTLSALTEPARPGLESYWQTFASSRLLSWKTGTSHGFRDAWALGLTPRYTLAVWVGNADGEGRPEISGLTAAAPILFALYQLVPPGEAFPQPTGDLRALTLCRQSGCLPGPYCHDTVETLLPRDAVFTTLCSHHQRIFVDSTGLYRVDSQCEAVSSMHAQDRLVLPPVVAYYYERWHPEYRPLPPWRADCAASQGDNEAMNLLYPPAGGMVYVPTQMDGQRGAVVFRLIHRYPERTVFWHLDEDFTGSTRHFHELSLAPSPGVHVLTLVDESGAQVRRRFTVLEKGNQ
jgi:penicillin-binding protein 1C